jgi:hypothetical protein
VSVHYSENVVRDQAKTAAQMKSRKYLAVGAGLAVLLSAGGAYAAMQIFGTGSVSATSYQAQNVSVSGEKFNKPIYPGVFADLSFEVANPNPFPVTVQSVAIDTSRRALVKCDAAGEESKLSGPATSTGLAYNIPTSEQVAVSPNGKATITIKNAVHLDSSATKGCELTIPFKVTGAGSGE